MNVTQEQIDEQWPMGAPGSRKAQDAGCICPIFDNGKGRGMFALGTDWYITGGCTLHDARGQAGHEVAAGDHKPATADR